MAASWRYRSNAANKLPIASRIRAVTSITRITSPRRRLARIFGCCAWRKRFCAWNMATTLSACSRRCRKTPADSRRQARGAEFGPGVIHIGSELRRLHQPDRHDGAELLARDDIAAEMKATNQPVFRKKCRTGHDRRG